MLYKEVIRASLQSGDSLIICRISGKSLRSKNKNDVSPTQFSLFTHKFNITQTGESHSKLDSISALDLSKKKVRGGNESGYIRRCTRPSSNRFKCKDYQSIRKIELSITHFISECQWSYPNRLATENMPYKSWLWPKASLKTSISNRYLPLQYHQEVSCSVEWPRHGWSFQSKNRIQIPTKSQARRRKTLSQQDKDSFLPLFVVFQQSPRICWSTSKYGKVMRIGTSCSSQWKQVQCVLVAFPFFLSSVFSDLRVVK